MIWKVAGEWLGHTLWYTLIPTRLTPERAPPSAAPGFDPAFPCHNLLLGANKWGLTSLRNLDKLPATGALLIVSPLPIVGGSGSPARVLALVER